MKVRPVQATDTDEWLRMRLALWPDGPMEEHLSEMQEYFVENAPVAAFVAERPEGGLGGFLEASIRPFAEGCETKPVGYIEGWYVDPNLRLQGLGARLVQAAEAWTVAHGLKEIASDCLIDNEVSLKAHLALGYREVERVIQFAKRLTYP